MFWIITAAGEGGEPMRIGHGYLPLSNRGPGGAVKNSEYKLFWVRGYLSSHGTYFPYEWQTLDDDGYLVYSGRCGDLNEANQENAFAPLDFSEADCGATTMQYRKLGESEWTTL